MRTRDNLWDHIEDTSCVLCGNHIETIDHLFFQCRTSNHVWTEIKAWLGFTRELKTIKAAVKWIIKEARGTGGQAIAKRMGIACTVYCIWKHRNAKMFEGKSLILPVLFKTSRCKRIDPFMFFFQISKICEGVRLGDWVGMLVIWS